MKITLLLFLICLLDQVYSYKMGNLKASEDMAEQRQINNSTTDGAAVDSPSNIDTTKRVIRPLDISKGNNDFSARFSWGWNMSGEDASNIHNNYYAGKPSDPKKPQRKQQGYVRRY